MNKHRLYSLLLLIWVGGFAIEAVRLWSAINLLQSQNDALTRHAEALNEGAEEINQRVKHIHNQSSEMQFLQGLINVLPQEKGFIRTQKAMEDDVEALRAKVGRRLHGELHIVVDTRANKLYLKRGLRLLWEADCSVGRGGILLDRHTGRRWEFVTPHGQFEVLSKIENPYWTKPDWAFVEEGKPVPPPDDPSRKVEGELGAYVLNLGDGYLIHGTKSEAVLGHSVSHGCVRLGAEALKNLFEAVPRGTKVYIY